MCCLSISKLLISNANFEILWFRNNAIRYRHINRVKT